MVLHSLSSKLLFFLYSFLLLFLLFASWSVADPDLYARMAMGRLIVERGGVPLTDEFAWTPKLSQWIDHEWLSGVAFYCLFHIGGDALLFLFKVTIAALTACVLAACYVHEEKISNTGIFSIALAMFGSSFLWFSTVRCQVFTYLLLPYCYYAILQHRKKQLRWPLFAILALMPLWANLHGGFVLGLITLGFYAFSCRAIFPFLILFTAILTTLINPYGAVYWDFIINALAKPRPQIAEWSAVSPLSLRGMLVTLFAMIVLSDQWKRRNSNLESYLIFFFSLYGAYSHARLIPLALFSALAFFPSSFENAAEKLQLPLKYLMLDKILTIATALVMVPAIWVFARFLIEFSQFRLDESRYPVAAVTWMKANLPPGKVLNPFDEGSYVLWQGYPQVRVSIDGRYEEVYPEDTFQKNACIFAKDCEKRAQLVAQWKPDYILVPRKSEIAIEAFGADWQIGFEGSGWVVLIHSTIAF